MNLFSNYKLFRYFSSSNLSVFLFFILHLNCVNLGNPQGLGPTGSLYSSYRIGVSENKEIEAASKMGKACLKRYAFLYVAGDASLEAAAKNGQIVSIKSINKEAFNILSVYSSLCTIVTGN
ncbi:TRL-like family protein [Leptospira ilyithenensis]|uniref:TRL-like family protein n=1 Tax=Leptospira ilyithenensis TaxID=2484901 RepID=A0A4R9LRB9_9LEPT|nr:TRL-like family protein [Leptospira ilyithenensis]TGN10922.1 TRL-like family protein [Leptospira ilyithenensis]